VRRRAILLCTPGVQARPPFFDAAIVAEAA
jgi:hypothetical protein